MRLLVRWTGPRLLVAAAAVSLLCLVMMAFPLGRTETQKPVEWSVDPQHKKLVHEHVHRVLESPCRPNSARQKLSARLPASGHMIQPFLSGNQPLDDELFLYPPPFGFRGLQSHVHELLRSLPDSAPLPDPAPLPGSAPLPGRTASNCRRCVVMGNGGILKGLELGRLIDRFDTIIRLNRGPLGAFSDDVGNRTSVRMSYPEGTPLRWVDSDPQTVFVAVVYKEGDLSWTSAMINKRSVPLWDWLFFWQKVPKEIPRPPQMFRLLNPVIIRQTALDLLGYPEPRPRLWGWDQNVPTLGVSALNLASLLCDRVSLAGFGYNLSRREVPLHYYDQLPMSAMQQQKMHDVGRETRFLQDLVREGAVDDLTGGVHCSFCSG